jgi:hypothetical protein
MFICFHCLVIITKVSLLYVRHGQEAADEQVALINTVGATWCHCRRVWRCCYFLQRGIWISILTTHVPLLHLQMFLSQSLENELKMETCVTIFPSALCFSKTFKLTWCRGECTQRWHANFISLGCYDPCFVLCSYRSSKTSSATCCPKVLLHIRGKVHTFDVHRSVHRNIFL